MIPKIIHFCWFGYGKKPKLIKQCIDSWKRMMPDWEIKEWNEGNYDITKISYISEAYKQKKWAFVVDYARFDILNQYGGIFLDTDVEMMKAIPDEFLKFDAFTGFENADRVAPGLIYASVPRQQVLSKITEVYENKEFGMKIAGRMENIVDIMTGILVQNGLQGNNRFQIVQGVAIFPKEYFCCFNHEIQAFEKTDNTISVHHYYASWSPWYRRLYFRMIKIVAKILGKEKYLWIKRRIKK